MRMYGPKMVENVVQGLARIVVFDQMARIDQMMRPLDTPERRHKVVLTVHDEIVAETRHSAATLEAIMTDRPKWAIEIDIPVAAECWTGERYRK